MVYTYEIYKKQSVDLTITQNQYMKCSCDIFSGKLEKDADDFSSSRSRRW